MDVFFLQPLILAPSVALLLVSTSNRFAQIHEEVHHLFSEDHMVSPEALDHLRLRIALFRQVLFNLYLSMGLLALATVVGAATTAMAVSQTIVIGFVIAAVLALLIAAVQLVIESRLSAEIIEMHLDDLADLHDM